jgi:drug/metabolite transporter (DMT)-like permease
MFSKTNKTLNNGAIFVSIAAILWSLDGILRTNLRQSLPAINIIFYEHLFGLILLLPIFFIKKKEILALKIREWLIFALIALFASVIATLFYTAGLGQVFFTSFSVVVLLQQLQPIWAILSAKILLKEKLPPYFILFSFLALFAAYLISFPDLKVNLETGQGTIAASIMGLFAGFFWGLGTTFGRFGLKEISFATATFLRFFLGTIFAGLFLWILTVNFSFFSKFLIIPLSSPEFSWSLNANQLFNFLLVVLFTGMGGMLVYYYGLKRVEAKIATLCELLFPLFAVLIEVFYDVWEQTFRFNPAVLSPTQYLGAALLLLVLYKIAIVKKSEKEVVI